jgi:3-isopropylmalate/(R)-2-methylmalate dehydratase small subunit
VFLSKFVVGRVDIL